MFGLASVGVLLALLLVLAGWWYADQRRANDQRVEVLRDGSRRVAARARALLPHIEIVELPRATHHTIPTEDTDPLVAALRRFLPGRLPDGGG